MRRRTLTVSAIWLGLAVVSAAQRRVSAASHGEAAPFAELLVESAIDWGSCAVFTPVVVWVVRRYPVTRRAWLHIAVQLAAIAVLVVAKYALHVALLARLTEVVPASLGDTLLRGFVGEAVMFGALFGIVHAVLLHDRARRDELEALALRAELADSRLDALVHKIEPHFLFNTLQAISTLLHRDPRAADAMVTGLSELLRELMRGDAPREVALAVELAWAQRYLELMRIRFGDRLAVAVDVPDELGEARVPRLILQPLLENALRHGAASTIGAAELSVTARHRDGELVIDVADNGGGAAGSTPGSGIGLAHTRERLRRLYGEAGQLETREPAGGGFCASVRLPYRSAG